MQRMLNDVVVIDAVRTAFGRAGEKGIFWNTRAEDLCVPLLKALIVFRHILTKGHEMLQTDYRRRPARLSQSQPIV